MRRAPGRRWSRPARARSSTWSSTGSRSPCPGCGRRRSSRPRRRWSRTCCRTRTKSGVKIVGAGVVRIDLTGSGDVVRFVDWPDPFDPAAPSGAVYRVTFDPVSFYIGGSEIGMVVDRLVFDASTQVTPPEIIARGQTPGWQGISIAEATLLLPPDAPLVDKLTVGVKDVLLGSPAGLQGEIQVELGRTPISGAAVEFLQELRGLRAAAHRVRHRPLADGAVHHRHALDGPDAGEAEPVRARLVDAAAHAVDAAGRGRDRPGRLGLVRDVGRRDDERRLLGGGVRGAGVRRRDGLHVRPVRRHRAARGAGQRARRRGRHRQRRGGVGDVARRCRCSSSSRR